MWLRIFFVVIIFAITPGSSQTLNNVNLLQIKTYMLKVIEETVHGLEDYGWCNLKIPDFSQDLRYGLFGRNLTATVTYKNGFVIRNQHADVTDSSLNQNWLWDAEQNSAYVRLTGQLRLHNLLLGFDVEAVDGDGLLRRYTSTFMHRLISFNLEIRTYMRTDESVITVTALHPASSNKMSFLPSDDFSEVLSALYVSNLTQDGVLAWTTDILQPIATDVVLNKVPFPNICYNCPR